MERLKTVFFLAAISILTACSGGAQGEKVERWMDEQESKVTPREIVLTEPLLDKEPEMYDADDSSSPFSLAARLRSVKREGFVPDCYEVQVDRREERPGDLEMFTLEEMSGVGFIKTSNGSRAVALIEVNGYVYKAGVGDYMGRNFGRVTKITDDTVYITETYYDPINNPESCDITEVAFSFSIEEGA